MVVTLEYWYVCIYRSETWQSNPAVSSEPKVDRYLHEPLSATRKGMSKHHTGIEFERRSEYLHGRAPEALFSFHCFAVTVSGSRRT
jgi:hypothetical protein